MIRPLYILKQSLEYILNKYKRTNGYRYICDQLKAIRQDLTVSFKDLLFMLYESRIFLKIGYLNSSLGTNDTKRVHHSSIRNTCKNSIRKCE